MISIFIFSSFSVQQMRESILYSNPNCYLCSSSVARLCQNSQSSKTWKSGDIFWNSLKQVGILDIWSKYFPTQGEFESQISLSTHSVLNRENIYGNSQFNLPCLLFPKSVEYFTHQSSKTCKADINYLGSFGEVGVMDTYIDQLFPKKVAEGQDFLYSHSMLKKKGGYMMSIIPSCYLCFSSGIKKIPYPSEFQDWQYRSQSFGKLPQKIWGTLHEN